ncbi:MAG: DoxX family membrane protein [Verrucomicrobia bacterium]|nr:DoxX family membrane protein [Verrucomicrobiota bacterium]
MASPSIDWRIVVAAIPLETTPSYGGLLYWMQEMVKWSSAEVQRHFVQDEVIPHFYFFAPQVYMAEVLIAVALILGLFSRLGALVGALMAINLWLGLYRSPAEWPWT